MSVTTASPNALNLQKYDGAGDDGDSFGGNNHDDDDNDDDDDVTLGLNGEGARLPALSVACHPQAGEVTLVVVLMIFMIFLMILRTIFLMIFTKQARSPWS